MPMLFQELIRIYSQNVNSGHSDTDVTKRQRRYLHVLLNLAGNSGFGITSYAIVTEEDRRKILQSMGKDVENVRWFLTKSEETDFDLMVTRAIEIVRNI